MGRLPKILSILAGVFALLLAISVYVGYLALKRFAPPTSMTRPSDLEKAQITKGAAKFQKATFYIDNELGTVTEIKRAGDSLAIVGTRAAVFLDEKKNVRGKVLMPASFQYSPVALVEPAGARGPFFLSRGSWTTPVIFADSSGRELWRYGGSPGVDYAAAGDVEGNGKIEIAVGMNGSGGIILLDANGKQIWSKADGNVWHVEILQGSSGVPGRIVHSNAEGKLVLRDGDGNVIEHRSLDMYLSDFGLTRWEGESEATHVLAADSETVYVYTAGGEPTAHFEAPAPLLYNDIEATTVLLSDGRLYFVALRRYRRWERSVLTINTIQGDHGNLIYREILEDACDSLMAIPSKDSQVLLMGCRGKVLQYDESP